MTTSKNIPLILDAEIASNDLNQVPILYSGLGSELSLARRPSSQQIPISNSRQSSDLFDFIKSRHHFFPESKIIIIFKQVVNAVDYLHTLGFVHRDIKDENVIIDSSFRTKLIDFGAGERIPSSQRDYFTSFRGSPRYTPPEMFKNPRHKGPEVDCWCLGILFFTLAFSCQPFFCTEDIIEQRFVQRPIERSSQLEGLLALMLDPNPNTRATIKQILEHPYLKHSD